MDKYSLQKYEIYHHQMWSFKFQMHQNPFSAGALPQTPVRELMTLPQDSYSAGEGTPRAEIPIPKEAKARQTSWIFLKIPPGISWKFA